MSFSMAAMLQGFDKTWGSTRDGNVVRWSTSLLGVVMVAWGLSSASGVGEVLGLVGPVGCP
jgi:hypothetical protein